ncbi:MAG: META domain-containing protein [Marinosulfonomonas sp.]|nr:MAG: META domain-containing protein [Marinosulfonomonas sp.]
MRILFAFLTLLALTACKYDESISGYTDADAIWTLVELDDKPFTARATITFPSKGKVTGQAPCNTYASTQTVPLPWFKLGPIMSTKMACADLATEQQFFAALSEMTLAETLADTMILTSEDGREMVFITAP